MCCTRMVADGGAWVEHVMYHRHVPHVDMWTAWTVWRGRISKYGTSSNFSHVQKTAGETRNGELLSNTIYDVSKTHFGSVRRTPHHEPTSNWPLTLGHGAPPTTVLSRAATGEKARKRRSDQCDRSVTRDLAKKG